MFNPARNMSEEILKALMQLFAIISRPGVMHQKDDWW